MRFAGTQLNGFMDLSDFDAISKSSMEGRSTERMYQAKSVGLVDQAGIDAEAAIKSAKYGASATRAQGAAEGQSAMFSGIASGIGSIAGGLASKASSPSPSLGSNPQTPFGGKYTDYSFSGGDPYSSLY